MFDFILESRRCSVGLSTRNKADTTGEKLQDLF